MKATIVDLRYKMKDVLRALERNEEVGILYHGKIKGMIKPVVHDVSERVCRHPFFGMSRSTRSVEAEMTKLRGGRYRDV